MAPSQAAFTIARYLATGNSEGPVWAVPLGGWDLMPALHYRLTPFGTEVFDGLSQEQRHALSQAELVHCLANSGGTKRGGTAQ